MTRRAMKYRSTQIENSVMSRRSRSLSPVENRDPFRRVPREHNFPSFDDAMRNISNRAAAVDSDNRNSHSSARSSGSSSNADLSIGARAALNEHLRHVARFGIDNSPTTVARTCDENENDRASSPLDPWDMEWDRILNSSSISSTRSHTISSTAVPVATNSQHHPASNRATPRRQHCRPPRRPTISPHHLNVSYQTHGDSSSSIDSDYFQNRCMPTLQTPESVRRREQVAHVTMRREAQDADATAAQLSRDHSPWGGEKQHLLRLLGHHSAGNEAHENAKLSASSDCSFPSYIQSADDHLHISGFAGDDDDDRDDEGLIIAPTPNSSFVAFSPPRMSDDADIPLSPPTPPMWPELSSPWSASHRAALPHYDGDTGATSCEKENYKASNVALSHSAISAGDRAARLLQHYQGQRRCTSQPQVFPELQNADCSWSEAQVQCSMQSDISSLQHDRAHSHRGDLMICQSCPSDEGDDGVANRKSGGDGTSSQSSSIREDRATLQVGRQVVVRSVVPHRAFWDGTCTPRPPELFDTVRPRKDAASLPSAPEVRHLRPCDDYPHDRSCWSAPT